MSATVSRIRVESVDRMLFRCFMQDLEDEARVYSFFAHCDLVVYFRHSLNFFFVLFCQGFQDPRKIPSPAGFTTTSYETNTHRKNETSKQPYEAFFLKMSQHAGVFFLIMYNSNIKVGLLLAQFLDKPTSSPELIPGLH